MVFTTRGNIALLSQDKVALFASRKTPPLMESAIFEIFDTIRALPIGLSGGWQSPVEKRLFKRMDSGQTANVLYYFARDLNTIRLSPLQEQLLAHDKLLMIAPETQSVRANKKSVLRRDQLLLTQNKKVCFLHITPGGRLETYFNRLLREGYFVYLLEHPFNESFYGPDVSLLNPDNVKELLTV